MENRFTEALCVCVSVLMYLSKCLVDALVYALFRPATAAALSDISSPATKAANSNFKLLFLRRCLLILIE